jgi:hypothetical protein
LVITPPFLACRPPPPPDFDVLLLADSLDIPLD